MKRKDKILVLGSNGLVGSSIVRKLKKENYKNIIEATRHHANLKSKKSTEWLFETFRPKYVFLAAARVGGIYANDTMPGEFFYDNIMIQTNVLECARKYNVKKLMFLGSSCIYPKECKQPIKEEYLMTGPLESTNDAYAVAKIAGLQMCKSYRKQWGCNFISAMPCNLYGVNDNFSLKNSHVLPALIRKFYEARLNNLESIELWGDGTPLREFLYVDDLADALYFLMENYNDGEFVNVGYGSNVTIKHLAETIKDVVGYNREIQWNENYPNGAMKKLIDSSKITKMGWKPKIDFQTGIKLTYEWFLENYQTLKNN